MKVSGAVVAAVAAVLMLGFTVGPAAAAEAPSGEGDVVVCIVGLGNDDN